MSTQELLTAAATFIELAALSLVAVGVLATALKPASAAPVTTALPSPTTAAPIQAAPTPATTEVSEQPQQPTIQEPLLQAVSIVVATPVVQQSGRTRSNTRQKSQSEILRQRCAAQGITWRNANGSGKHLTVRQMQQHLGLGQTAIA